MIFRQFNFYFIFILITDYNFIITYLQMTRTIIFNSF